MDPPKIVTYKYHKKFVSIDPLHRVTTDNNWSWREIMIMHFGW